MKLMIDNILFENTYIQKIKSLYKKNFAHINKESKELLEEHSSKSIYYFNKLCNKLIEKQIVKNCFSENELKVLELAIYLHDFGKLNPRFQYEKMKENILNIEKINGNSNHSIYSAYILIALMSKLKKDICDFKINNKFIFNISYLISKHHSFLGNIDYDYKSELLNCEQVNWFNEMIQELGLEMLSENGYLGNNEDYDYFDKFIISSSNSNNKKINKFIQNKLSFSLIVVSDFTATYDYFNNKEFEFYKKLDYSKYFQGSLYEKINSYKNGLTKFSKDDINKLRSDMAIEVEKEIQNDKNNIFELEMPCGAGKTNVALLASNTLIKENKDLKGIIYTSPFNSITDQNVDIFKNYFGNIQVINSTTDINLEEYNENNIESVVLDYQTGNFNFIGTSHVHLFDIIFGNSRTSALNFLFLCNKVIIIDEIQAYTPRLWKITINMFNAISDLLNIRFIIMSATLPHLNFLNSVDNEYIIKDLLPNKKYYYQNSLFKDRVNFEVIKQKIKLEDIIKERSFYNHKKVLYEFISKKTCFNFYNKIRKVHPDLEVYELTGDSNRIERNKIIKKVRENETIIVISTQVIEAGVDLDFDYGFKDTSLPDSEIQFLGRINRSCKHKGYAVFFNYDSGNIYKEDARFKYNILDSKIEDSIRQQDNISLYKDTLNYLKEKDKYNNIYNFEQFVNDCDSNKFQNVCKEVRLIDKSNKNTLYIAYNLEIDLFEDIKEQDKKLILDLYSIFEIKNEFDIITKDNNKMIISGKNLWEFMKKYEHSFESFSKKFILLKKINVIKNYFIFSLFENIDGKIDIECIDKKNKYYYTENQNYLIDGKINRNIIEEKLLFI